MKEEKAKLTNDLAFQLVFGKLGNESIIKKLIEDLVEIKIEKMIVDTNKGVFDSYSEDELGKIDVKAVLSDNTTRLIELQIKEYYDAPEELLLDCAKNVLKREDCKTLSRGIFIVILSKNLSRIDDLPKYHTIWSPREEGMLEPTLEDYLQIHIIELPKFKETEDNGAEGNWINLIKNGEIDESKETSEELRAAEEELKKILANPEMRELYYKREKERLTNL